MQKWDYYAAYVEYNTKRVVPVMVKASWPSKGMVETMQKAPAWVSTLPSGQEKTLPKFLEEMGENGWEIVGSALAQSFAAGTVSEWFRPDHWLYFKRPKADNI